MSRRLLVVAAVVGALPYAPAAAAAPVGLHAGAEAGPELDTNATRVSRTWSSETQGPVMAPLFRVNGSAGLKGRLGRQLFALDYGGGGKLFLTDEGRPADELVHFASAGWGPPVGGAGLWFSGSYYDAFQRESTRDFRTGTAGVQLLLDRLPAALRASLDLGYRGLAYKPLPDYSFQGLLGGIGIRWRGTSGPEAAPVEWEVHAGYAAGLRFFSGPVLAVPDRCSGKLQFPCVEDRARRDFHHQGKVEASYLGNASAGLAYTVEINRSSSYGESYVRHALGLRFTAALIWGLFMTAKATLQLSRFQDPFLVSQVSTVSFVSVDDENRSSLLVQLSKEIDEHWAVNLRWSLYVNESSLQGDSPAATLVAAGGFLRQTVFLGVRFEYGR